MRYLTKMLSRAFLALGAFMLPLAASAQNAAGDFVLLTEKDGPFGSLATKQADLPMFLNTVYTLVIGIAVVLAVLQIVRGGILWMLTDSFTEKSQARHLITIAVMGLVLVLSPVIVFNIINPCILNLSLTGSSAGDTSCQGSLGELPAIAQPPPDPAPDPNQPQEIHKTYIHYGKVLPNSVEEFISTHCSWVEDGVDTKVTSPFLEIVCGDYLKLRTFALCPDGTGGPLQGFNCSVKGVLEGGDAGIMQNYENECLSMPGAEFGARGTAFGVQFLVDPDSFLNPHLVADGCEDEELEQIKSTFYPSGEPEGSDIHCFDMELMCQFD